ncbi:uncharacterized protein LOC129568556 [Sitodiplosis mosellana]|uniref:uncharacterized protein LOC129568556 n=1 Tax=Sitodiplosis mosellana TaxID=263140 RepID=UPI0024445DBC|nr:uncharacterized protein LOC129568556 [Sitodiplosis mosellana]
MNLGKKASGAQNRKRQLEKQAAALANSQDISRFMTRERSSDSIPDVDEEENQHDEISVIWQLFSFLYDFENYETNRNNGSLQESCKKLEIALTHDGKSDIDGDDLFVELSLVSTLVKQDNINHAIDILNSIQKRKMENLVPNAAIALRILLTIPVSVATGERSFSRLKLTKTYLRNAIGQDRLNHLAIISIESDVANSIQYDDVIEEFATSKARKKTEC